ncbi:MAG: peptidoglycan-binding domain-containing protein [Solirubrobacteraceae bacterium]
MSLLQQDLTLAGFPTSTDGYFGRQTKASVVSFQRAHALIANGTVTSAVVNALAVAVSALETGGAVQKAHINPDGTATAPADAPPAVRAVIAAANQIIAKPYIYAGGHASWIAPGYDCSGAVSYALHGGGLLSAPLAVEFEGYGSPGPGRWITVYADSQHVFAAIAGLAFDTADYGGPNIPAGTGPRWRSDPTGNLADGGDYVVRHPAGL